jgi:uncharacterized protein
VIGIRKTLFWGKAMRKRFFWMIPAFPALLGLFAAVPALAASFDCAQARSHFERTVCADERLSRLDEELDQAYRAALERQSQAEAVAELKDRQREWLRVRRSEKDADRLSWDYSDQIGYLRNLPDFPSSDTPVEPSYPFNDVSKTFDFTIRALPNDENGNSGQVLIRKKGKKEVLQTINLGRIIPTFENGALLTNMTKLYDLQSFFHVGDFNFDGHDDFSIYKDNHGPYGGPTYAVYLFDPKLAHFRHSIAFSELTEMNLGFFGVDPVRKRLRTASKSGCCYHVWEELTVVRNVPVVVTRITEEVVFGDETLPGRLRITEEHRVKGTWRRKVRYKQGE